MKRYILKYVNEKDIIVEKNAKDTWQNFMYTKELIGNDATIVIVTSDFHMYRSKFIASEIGFTSVYGECAKVSKDMFLYYNLREVVSIIRDFMKSLVLANKH